MNDARCVGCGERRRDARGDADGVLEGEPAVGVHCLPERHTLEVLHHEVGRPVGKLSEVEDLDDVLTADGRRRLGFRHEAADRFVVLCEILPDDLERDGSLDGLALFGHEHNAHPSLSDLLEKLVRANVSACVFDNRQVDGRLQRSWRLIEYEALRAGVVL